MLLENTRKAERITDQIRRIERAIKTVEGGLFSLAHYPTNSVPGNMKEPSIEIVGMAAGDPLVTIVNRPLFKTIQSELIAALRLNLASLKLAFVSPDESSEYETGSEA